MNDRYYSYHARSFYERTVSVDMDDVYRQFLPFLERGSLVLDAGCGSGRDAKAFKSLGFQVVAFDASAELAALAETYSGVPVEVCRFQDVKGVAIYDGIWACASLLHVPEVELPGVLATLWATLKEGGFFYSSFKYGDGEREEGIRHFTDANNARLEAWAGGLKGVDIVHIRQSVDKRVGEDSGWANMVLRKNN